MDNNAGNDNNHASEIDSNQAQRHPDPRRQRRRLNAVAALVAEEMNLLPQQMILMQSSILTRITRMAGIRELTDPDAKESTMKTSDRYIDLQVLRIIVPDQNKTKAMVYSRTGKGSGPSRRQGAESSYERMYMCRVYDCDSISNSGEVVYLMQGGGDNKNLWSREILSRDNGTLTIGTYFRIIWPEHVERYLNNECPMIVSKEPAVLMKLPPLISDVPVTNLQANDTKSFVINNATLTVRQVQAMNTKCTGLVCDKQRLGDMRDNKCGCWNYKTMRHSLTMNHSIVIGFIDANIPKITEQNFTSHRFVGLYIDRPFPTNMSISELQGTEEIFIIQECVDDMVSYVNQHDGWTVVGWCRLGMVTDKSLINNTDQYNNGADQQVESGETKYHVITMYPSNPNFRERGTPQNDFLVANKYKIDSIA